MPRSTHRPQPTHRTHTRPTYAYTLDPHTHSRPFAFNLQSYTGRKNCIEFSWFKCVHYFHINQISQYYPIFQFTYLWWQLCNSQVKWFTRLTKKAFPCEFNQPLFSVQYNQPPACVCICECVLVMCKWTIHSVNYSRCQFSDNKITACQVWCDGVECWCSVCATDWREV